MNLPKIRASFAAIAAAIAYLIVPSTFAAILAQNNFEESRADFVADIGGEDASAITAYDSNYPSTTAPYPFTGSGAAGFGSNYLKVDTGDATIFREFDAQTSSTYLDAYMQFEPTSGEISYTNVAKIVVYLDAATSNLCVISGTAENNRAPITNCLDTAAAGSATVVPGTWGRLTVNAIKTPSDNVFKFNVLLNGNTLSVGGTTDTFYSLTDSNAVSRVGFKGTGALDDLVARTSDPFGTAATIGGETYGSLAQAGEEAVGGQTILLETASNEDITLREVGVVFNTNGKSYSGTISGASGVGISEENGIYTSIANTASTWTGSVGDGLWENAQNWSTKSVPTSATTVTFNEDAIVNIPYNSAVANGIVISEGYTLTLRRSGETPGTAWSTITVGAGGVSGSGTVKLVASGINKSVSSFTINANLEFENDGTHDSFLGETVSGSFTINGTVTGSGYLQVKTSTTFNGNVTIPAGSLIKVNSWTYNLGTNASLYGAGTLKFDAVEPSDSMKTALQDKDKWTGVCEIYNKALEHINAAKYGNVNSTVRYNGVTGYSAFSSGNTLAVGNVKCIDIGASGLTYNNGFSSDDFGYTYACALTGTGTITFGSTYGGSGTYTFTGDASAFAGTISYGSIAADKKAAIVFNSTDAASPTVEKGQIGVAEGTTLGLADFAGTAVGGGRIIRTATPTTSYTGICDPTAWTGEFVIKAGGKLRLPAYGQKVVIGSNVSGFLANSAGNGVSDASTGELRLDANLTMNNGWSRGSSGTEWETNLQKINKLSGTGNLNLTWGTTVDQSSGVYYQIATLDGSYSGTITAGGYTRLRINTVDVESVPLDGTRVTAITLSGDNAKIYNSASTETTSTDGLINVTVGGMIDPNDAKLFRGDDGLYVAVAKVGDTYYRSLRAAADAARAADTTFTRVYAGAGDTYPGWTYSDGIFTYDNKVAYNATKDVAYATLQDAITASSAEDIIQLLEANSETGIDTTGKDFFFDDNGYAFSGTWTGSGRIVLKSAPSTTTWSSALFVTEGWIGTVTLDWGTIDYRDDSVSPKRGDIAGIVNKYGIAASTVEIGQNSKTEGNCYFNGDTTPKLKVSGFLYINDGSSTTKRTIGNVCGDGVFVFGNKANTVNYEITNLNDWNGILTNMSARVTVGTITRGNGVVYCSNKPSPAPTIDSGYTGEIELAFNWQNVDLSAYSGDNATLVLNYNMNNGYFAENNGGATGIKGKTVINGTVSIVNGWPRGAGNYWSDDRCVKFNTLEVAGSISLIYPTGNGWKNYWGYISAATLDGDSTGSITVGNNFLLKVNAVDFAAAPSGTGRLVSLALTGENDSEGYTHKGKLYGPNGVAGEAIPVTVGGVATGQKLVYATVNDASGLYLAVAQYGSNYYATFQDALNARKAAGGSGDITVLDATAPLPEGYSITDGKLVRTLKPMVILF